jgi:hypothetical protein
MKNSLIKRMIAIPLLVGTVALGNPRQASAQSCFEKRFYDLLGPIVQNPEDVKSDADKKVYVRFDSELDSINEILRYPERFDLTSAEGKEPVYQTFNEAMKAREKTTQFIAEIDVNRESLMYNQVTNLFDNQGKKLKGYKIFRCLDSPLKFEE